MTDVTNPNSGEGAEPDSRPDPPSQGLEPSKVPPSNYDRPKRSATSETKGGAGDGAEGNNKAEAGDSSHTSSSYAASADVQPVPVARSQQHTPQRSDIGAFASELLDLGFTHFVTPGRLKLVYLAGVIYLAVTSLLRLISALTEGIRLIELNSSRATVLILRALLESPVRFAVGVVFLRLVLELAQAIFRIEQGRRKTDEE